METVAPETGRAEVGAAAAAPAAAVAAARTSEARLYFVDNLRVFLTVLVIVHHLLITYAGSGSWAYMEVGEDIVTLAVGSWVLSVNQAFFMGLFLLISAYFVPGSYDRKGAGRFLKDRLVRLGIPLAVYSWIVSPVFIYLLRRATGELSIPFWRFFPGLYFDRYGALIGAGPLWFIETLLIFSAAYALWRLARPRLAGEAPPARMAPFPGSGSVGNGSIALFALLLSLATFLVRLVWRVGWSFGPLNLQFPHFAQYIALFVVGLVAYRRNWLRGLPDRTGRLWLWISAGVILLFVPMALVLDAPNNSELFKGGWSGYALVYALWESFLCVGLCIGLIYLFRRRANRQGAIARFLSRNAYTAYLIHAPVITFMALAARDVMLYPLLKFALAALAAIPLCFALSALVRRLPYADRVL